MAETDVGIVVGVSGSAQNTECGQQREHVAAFEGIQRDAAWISSKNDAVGSVFQCEVKNRERREKLLKASQKTSRVERKANPRQGCTSRSSPIERTEGYGAL